MFGRNKQPYYAGWLSVEQQPPAKLKVKNKPRMAPQRNSGTPEEVLSHIRMQRFEEWCRKACKDECSVCEKCMSDLREMLSK